jgi:alkanesulfonate monooxygenase SsuD/methylene tetrahydromethanopterin reductase-like flavin-dependent oxidoreductase (luciferase family)
MNVEFGLALIESHPKTERLNQWLEDLEATLPGLAGHFKSLWMTDHLFWNDLYAYEAWTVLSFLAGRFKDFDVGPMVLGQNYRNPALLAKMAATLQVFSEGRYIMGIGAGWKEDEYRAYDWKLESPKVRLEQLEDTCEIFLRMWNEPGKVTYHGKHYKIVDAILEPKPSPRPIMCLGVLGERAHRIAAQYGDWYNTPDAKIEVYKQRLGWLAQACESIGRDPASIRKTWFGRVAVGRTEAEAVQVGLSRAHQRWTHENAFVGTPAQIVEQMGAHVAAGCSYFMIDVVGFPDADRLAMVTEEIIPKLSG